MRTLIVIPARKNSSFHGKNLYPLNSKPLISYTIDCAKGLDRTKTIVTTDCHYIKAEAESHGLEVHDRPKDLATSEVTLDRLMFHISNFYPDYDIYICLPPTSPLRDAKELSLAYNLFKFTGADSVISVTEERRSIWKKDINFARPVVEVSKCRQWVDDPAYVCNGALFITKRHIIQSLKKKYGGRVALHIMSVKKSVDIHDLNDINLAEFYLK